MDPDGRRASGDSKPRVEVGTVTEGGDGKPRTARLSYVWRLAGNVEALDLPTPPPQLQPGAATTRWRVRLDPDAGAPGPPERASRLRLTTAFADRADILGAGGTPAGHRAAGAAVRHRQDQRPRGRGRVARPARWPGWLDIDPAPYAERVAAAGPKAFVEAIVLRPADARPQAPAAAAGIPGAAVVRDTLPLAPTREFARPMLGTVGPVDRGDRQEVRRRLPGRGRGRAERAGGEVRRAAARHARRRRRGRGRQGRGPAGCSASTPQRRRPARAPPSTPGCRRLAEQVLDGVAPASALVAIRPSTGDVLAAASGPGGGGLSTATVGQYAPGSTFKVVTSLALLRSGLEPSSTMYCPATVVVDGKRFKNYDDYPAGGSAGSRSAPRSRTPATPPSSASGRRSTQPELAEAAASLGLGVDHDLGFPAYFGEVPRTRSRGRLGDRARRLADRPGPGDRLPAGDGGGGRVGGAGAGRGAPAAPGRSPTDDTRPADPADRRRRPRSCATLMRGVVTQGSGPVPGRACPARRCWPRPAPPSSATEAAAADARLDDRGARRPGRRGVRRRRRLRLRNRRADPRAVPAPGRLTRDAPGPGGLGARWWPLSAAARRGRLA